MRPNFTFRIHLLILLSFLIFNCSFLIATIRYVSKTGLSIPPYISWENAADSIQKCINISVFGDTIYVANGVYEEQVIMIPGLSLIGAGTDSCIVDSRSFPLTNNRTITMQDACQVKGFYIRTSNNFDYGRGIHTEGQSGLITGNKFSIGNTGINLLGSNITVYKNYFFNIRFGITLTNSNSIVRKNLILMNVEGVEGIDIAAVTNNYTPVIDSNDILNVYDTGIYKFFGSRPIIKNNYIQVKYSTGIELNLSDSTRVFNNVIINPGYAGINSNSFTNLLIYNNYIRGQSGSYGIKVGGNGIIKNNVVTYTDRGIGKWGTQSPTVQYNDSWNNNINYDEILPDSTNLSVDPMIVNYDTTQGDLNFHLQMYSPLIDTGDPNILDKDSTRSDIGLYGGPYGESYIYVDLPPRPPVNFIANVDSGSSYVVLTWNRNTEADTAYYSIYRDSTINFTIDPSKLISSQADTLLLDQIPPGYRRVVYKITAIDQQGNESLPSEEQVINIVGIDREPQVVRNYLLYQNYPNPFNPSTKIGYKLKERGYVKMYVYSVTGELVSVLVNQVQEAGYYEVLFDAGYSMLDAGKKTTSNGLSSGVYIYQIMVTGENNIPIFSDIKKMVYVK